MIAAALPVEPQRARDDVRAILDGHRFHPDKPPQPIRGLLEWIGSGLEAVFAPVGRFFAPLFRHLPAPVAAALLAVIVAALIAGVFVAIQRRASRRLHVPSATADIVVTEESTTDPAELELLAQSAERAADWSLALRLRFRAGLLRLDHDAHAIDLRPGLTTHDVRERLRSQRFDALADTFEEVSYAGRDARQVEVATARSEWPTVVKESRRG